MRESIPDVRSIASERVPSNLDAWFRGAFAVLGILTIATAVVLVGLQVAMPELVRDSLGQLAEGIGQEPVAWLLAGLGTTYGFWRVFRGRSTPAVAPELAEDPPEESRITVTRTGHRFEDVVEREAASVSDPETDGEDVREALADVAVDVMTRDGEWTAASARTAIATGEWTDDRIAAAFLGDQRGPDYPLEARIRGWFRPGAAYERRVERTTDAIYRHLDGQADVVASPAGADEVEVVA